MQKMLRRIKDILKDFSSQIKRFFPGEISGDVKNNLSKNQIYPIGVNLIKVLNEDSKHRLKDLNFSKELNIASIGTCFAEELSGYLNTTKIPVLPYKKKEEFAQAYEEFYTTKVLD